MTFFSMIFVNFLIGICTGLTGLGFLLPIFYTGFFHLPAAKALAFTFSSFTLSGILGAYGYKKSGNLDVKTGIFLSIGSFFGALFGVRINLFIPESIMIHFLYLVVLCSGLSVLFQNGRKKTRKPSKTELSSSSKTFSASPFIITGFLTGAICSAAGAGGPILVIPVLTLMGVAPHTAIGIALFDSIFVSFPAAIGYVKAAALDSQAIYSLLILIPVFGIGTIIGSKIAPYIRQDIIKILIALLAISISCFKLFL